VAPTGGVPSSCGRSFRRASSSRLSSSWPFSGVRQR
jgi:hypothetical protein